MQGYGFSLVPRTDASQGEGEGGSEGGRPQGRKLSYYTPLYCAGAGEPFPGESGTARVAVPSRSTLTWSSRGA